MTDPNVPCVGVRGCACGCARANRYRAPEVLYGSKVFSPEVDVWAVGCILAEMGLRQPLCFGEREMTVLMKIIQVRACAAHTVQ